MRPFLETGGTADYVKARLDYNTPSTFGGTFPSWTNVLTDEPAPTHQEIIYDPSESDVTGIRRRLRPEQKPIALFAFLIKKYTKNGDLVCDLCAGTFPAAKACLQL